MNLISISSLKDNYIWLLHNDYRECIVIDPGEATSVLQQLSINKLKLTSILLTHHHDDHVSGVFTLLQYFPVSVYGPQETISKGANIIIKNNDNIILLNKPFKVLSLPGHTLGHIGYYSNPWLFCGDTVFSAGCGRIFEGTFQQMYESCQKINKLPTNTLICSGHEYTLVNLAFALLLLPEDNIISDYQRHVKQLINQNKSSLPTTLGLERLINVFFRCHDILLQKAINTYPRLGEEWKVFAILRKKRDTFSINNL
ncbi:hydroxyacylglutathione hydrolase, partial [Candidatus Palibaumannia cicadellinicola]|uniref:hydroxyacylglutathione hydrolase n=1 Tax=Candidatus Palibaumannia cicadellinicola TaxID=186490 RepID=UPI000C7871A0